MKFWSNFSLVLFGKGREIHRTTNSCNNLEKFIYKFWQIHVTTLAGMREINRKEMRKYVWKTKAGEGVWQRRCLIDVDGRLFDVRTSDKNRPSLFSYLPKPTPIIIWGMLFTTSTLNVSIEIENMKNRKYKNSLETNKEAIMRCGFSSESC